MENWNLKQNKKIWVLNVFLKVQKLNNIWEKIKHFKKKIEVEKNKILFGNYQLKNIS